MFIRGTRLSIPIDKAEALIDFFGDETAPKVREVAGNRGSILLLDRETGEGWALTYWEDEAALEASEGAGSTLRAQVVDRFGATVKEIERMELVITERTGPPRVGTFVRVNDTKGDPDRIEDGIRFTRETAVPRVREQQGFRAFILAVNRGSGRMLISTVWDSRDDLEASEAAASPVREEALKAIGAPSVDIHVYESVFADLTLPVAQA